MFGVIVRYRNVLWVSVNCERVVSVGQWDVWSVCVTCRGAGLSSSQGNVYWHVYVAMSVNTRQSRHGIDTLMFYYRHVTTNSSLSTNMSCLLTILS